MLERTVVVGSFSKGFAMTGWRLGFAFGPSWLMDQLLKVITYETSCAPSVSQRAAYHALRQDPMVFQRMVQEFQRRRDLVYDALHRMEGVRVHRPRGAFYIFPDLSHIAPRWESLALRLLEEERVVVVPGSAFGPSGAGCVRIAYTVDLPALKEAMLRIHRFLERIRKEGRVGV
jgi:aspartate/methionine/tyrosine aminotransferase